MALVEARHEQMASPHEKSQWALWAMIWCFDNGSPRPPEPMSDLCSTQMKSWLSLLSNEERSHAFEQTLFRAQQNSHRLLQEWLWWLSYIKADITSTLGLVAISKQWDIDAYGSSGRPQTVTSDMTNSTYNKALSSLLFNEFSPISSTSLAKTRLLQLSRKDSAIHAACMRIARDWWEGSTTQETTKDGEHCGNQQSPSPPRLFPGNVVCASINPCPWLEFETSGYDLPFYLWDIERNQTITLSDVKEDVEGYIAISHTWGRWKLKAEDGSTIVTKVQGVEWDVPTNSRFDVGALPQILKGLRNDTRYVWMDLLCIPQDGSLKANEEIARQGAIFRNASKCICWANEVVGWDSTRMVVEWLGAQYLLQCGDDLYPGGQQVPEAPRSDSLCELVPGGKDFYSSGSWSVEEVNPWFTSLWTLQEVCIRPDMILCDKNFSVLGIGSACWPVTVADISALLYMVRTDEALVGHAPTGFTQLFNLFAVTGLINIFKLSRTMILQLGNIRQCSSRRAEAIMSAMGIVNWFLPYTKRPNSEGPEPLVLGMYPLPFIQELRDTAGSGVFFSDATLDFDMVLKMFWFENWPEHLRRTGSLLPFGPGRTTDPHDSSIIDDEEPSTRSWVIDEFGMVKITRAFIQASSEEDLPEPFICTWFAPAKTSADYDPTFILEPSDLGVFLRNFKPDRRNFAVSLVRNTSLVHGVLLKELSDGLLMKIGSYTWAAPSKGALLIGREVDVDWTVL